MEGGNWTGCLPRGHPSSNTDISILFRPHQSRAEAHYIRSLRPSHRVSLITLFNASRRASCIADWDSVAGIFIAYLEAYVNFRKYGGTSIDAVDTLVWQQVLCGYSLVSATTPCLKGFLGRFRTEDFARVTEGSSGTRSYGHSSRTRTDPETYVLESLDGKISRNRPPNDEPTVLACGPADVQHSATAYAEGSGDNGDGSVKSFGSERMMIHRKVEYDVTSS